VKPWRKYPPAHLVKPILPAYRRSGNPLYVGYCPLFCRGSCPVSSLPMVFTQSVWPLFVPWLQRRDAPIVFRTTTQLGKVHGFFLQVCLSRWLCRRVLSACMSCRRLCAERTPAPCWYGGARARVPVNGARAAVGEGGAHRLYIHQC
jgi:hypothetical protein